MDFQLLLDERAIVHGLRRFAEIADQRLWSALAEVFAEDVAFNYVEGGRGLDELLALMAKFLDRCGPTQHLLGSIAVDVNGDQAVSRCYVQARHQAQEPQSDRFFDTNGEYIDAWERRAVGWRIVSREARWSCMIGDRTILWDA